MLKLVADNIRHSGLRSHLHRQSTVTYAEIAPKPPLAQKCFGEIAVYIAGSRDSDSGSRNIAWPIPIVLIVRVICVAPPKTGNI